MGDRKIGKVTVELDATKFSEQLAEVAEAIRECAARIKRTAGDDEISRPDCMRCERGNEPDGDGGVPFFGSLCEDNAAAVATATCEDLKAAWNVGDELRMHLSASEDGNQPEQDVVWVVMGFDCKRVSDDGCFARDSRAVIGLKDGLEKLMRGGDEARDWLIDPDGFSSMLPGWFANLFVDTINRSEEGACCRWVDRFWLPSETEVFGCTQCSDGELEEVESQLPYYAGRRDRRVKHRGIVGSASGWWERSPGSDRSDTFCFVFSDGSADWDGASGAYLLAPAGCF